MAIEKTQLLDILNNGEVEAEAKADSLLEMIQKDLEEQTNKIKLNREQIKNEKTEEINKRHAVEEKNKKLEEQLATLQEQMKANSPEGMQKVYNEQLSEARKVFETQASELKAKLEESEKQNAALVQEKFKLSCLEEFNKAITGKNVAPDAVQDLARYVLGDNCCKFSKKPLGDGNELIVTEDGQTIKGVLEDVLNNTTFGKRCVVVNTSGGGAEGGSKSVPPSTVNPWKKETFNLTKQAEIMRTDPALAAALKSQA